MRTQYPHLVAGAIASSGELLFRLATPSTYRCSFPSLAVTHAQINFPQYHDPIQKYAPAECIATLQSAIKTIDSLLDLPEPVPTALKTLFGLGELKDNSDFADVLISPTGKYLWSYTA